MYSHSIATAWAADLDFFHVLWGGWLPFVGGALLLSLDRFSSLGVLEAITWALEGAADADPLVTPLTSLLTLW